MKTNTKANGERIVWLSIGEGSGSERESCGHSHKRETGGDKVENIQEDSPTSINACPLNYLQPYPMSLNTF
ncbi:hypothetical protein EUGRSUZ_B00921 [Eucalyptus grandis]|uniref:Uncharacterized protein n=1 Tax=Eucalyptus grandis TaxID=71139 RepID=A0A059D0C6_EUCGR|nr:hypothetical protein EUGRSUZ_B00921 [Eucalyptus grandis]